MEGGRRKFLKAAGLTVLGIGAGKPILSALAQGEARPTAVPATGLHARRWGMLVDTRKCKAREGCKDCRLACNAAHNVPDLHDVQHEIKWIWTEPYKVVFPSQEHEFMRDGLETRPVALLCNHCTNPACVRVCPTKATWKRADGIVMMDWHRCIGCRYCVVACPYGARSFNWKDPRLFLAHQNPDFPTRMRGVVEKCNFCEERLAKGLLPACVTACKPKCIVFGDLDEPGGELRQRLRAEYTIQRKPGLGTGPNVYYIV